MSLLVGLETYWKLDESSDGSGAVTRVDSHASQDLADNNTTASGTGKINNGADFEVGNSEYLSAADSAILSTGDIDFSIACWFTLESLGGDPGLMIKGPGSCDLREYALRVGGDNKIRFQVSPDGTAVGEAVVVGNSGSALSAATFYFVVAYHDATANVIGISVNDETPVTTAHTTGLTDLGGAFWMGRHPNGTNYHDGIIDEAGFWKKVLSSDERTNLYNSGSGLAYSAFGLSQVVAGSITNTGALTRKTLKVVAGSITNTGAVNKLINLAHGFAGTITNTGSLVRMTKKITAGTITNTGSLFKRANKVVAGAITKVPPYTSIPMAGLEPFGFQRLCGMGQQHCLAQRIYATTRTATR